MRPAKNSIKKALYYGGFYKLRCAAKTIRKKRLLILMYHDLIKGGDDSDFKQNGNGKLTAAVFEAHLKAIRNSCRSLSVEDAIKEIRYGGGLKENTVAITFDDGYRSSYDLAFPLLKKYGLTATIYILNDWINGNLSLWWEELGHMFNSFDPGGVNAAQLREVCKEISIDASKYRINEKNSRKRLLKIMSHELMKVKDSRRKELLENLQNALFGHSEYKGTEINPLGWDQISEMTDSGIMFGAHTCSHVNMSYADMDLARNEISRSKNEIENRLGKEISGFAYPYGYDVVGYARFASLLQDLGFDYACTSWWGNNSDDSSLFQLLRNVITPMKSQSLLKREIYINLSEGNKDLTELPANYP